MIELMMTVSIAMILLTVAAPNFFAVINNNRLTVEANDLVANLSLARSQAKTRKQRVVVCKSSNGEDCSTAETTNWEDGWVMYVDDDQRTILRASTGLSSTNTLRVDTVFGYSIGFLPDGRSIGDDGDIDSGSATPPTEGEFRLCDSRGASFARAIQVSPIGRAKVVRERGVDSCP